MSSPDPLRTFDSNFPLQPVRVQAQDQVPYNAADEDQQSEEKTNVVQGDTFKLRIQRAGSSPPSLVMLEGPAGYVGKQWPITTSETVIGRSMNSPIYVDDRSVSKAHAKVMLTDGEIYIIDLESTNHTVVNDDTIPPLVPVKLANNDQIKTGNVLFKFLEKGNIEALAIEQLTTKSEKDTLTGIYNKGYLLMKGGELIKRAKLLKVPLCIAVFDIDHFKKVNDTYGHPAGDAVLKEIGSVVQNRLIRMDDLYARYGGEEFVVVLFGSNLAQSMEIGERLRTTIEGHHFQYDAQKLNITISVGVAALEDQTSRWEELFLKADQALYASKHAGRNRVTAAPSSSISGT